MRLADNVGARQTLEVADGIPAPFPLVAHQPSPTATTSQRQAQRPPRQHSRANLPERHTFAACLLSAPPLNPDESQSQDQDAGQGGDPSWQSWRGLNPEQAGCADQLQGTDLQQEAGQADLTQPAHLHHDASTHEGSGLYSGDHESSQGQHAHMQQGLHAEHQSQGHYTDASAAAQGDVEQQADLLHAAIQDAAAPLFQESDLHPNDNHPEADCPEPEHASSSPKAPVLACPDAQHGVGQHALAPPQQAIAQRIAPFLEDDQQQRLQEQTQLALSQQPGAQQQQLPSSSVQVADQQLGSVNLSHTAQAHHNKALEAEQVRVPANVQPGSQQASGRAHLAADVTLRIAAPVRPPGQSLLSPTSLRQHLAHRQGMQTSAAEHAGLVTAPGHEAISTSEAATRALPSQSVPGTLAHSSSPVRQASKTVSWHLDQQHHHHHQQPQQQQQQQQRGVSSQSGTVSGDTAQGGASNNGAHEAPYPGPAQHEGEEQYEQDVMSQPSSSDSDEDFAPDSEFEQDDEMSQPDSSSSEDAYEQDEMSQPESSSEEELRFDRVTESGIRLAAAAASRRASGSKPFSLRPVSKKQLARLGFPKAAQPTLDDTFRPSSSSPTTAKQMRTWRGQRKRISTHDSPDQDGAEARQAQAKRRRTSKAVADAAQDVPKATGRQPGRKRTLREQPTPDSVQQQVRRL